MVHEAFTASSVSCGRTRWIRLAGELDLATAPSLGTEFDRAAAERTRAVVLDLSRLSFMDCAAARAVVEFADGARTRGWQLRIVGPPTPVMSRFARTPGGRRLPFGSAA
jgi:anti-anti-sigma factor